MRKLKIVNIFFILLLFIGTMSCAVKKKSKVGLKLTLGGLTSLGAKQDGGAMLYGKSDNGNSLAKRLDLVSESEINFQLENGTWDFYVMTWDGDHDQTPASAAVKLTGKVLCAAVTGQQLAGSDVTINLNLTNAKCDDNRFASNRKSSSGTISFPKSFFKTCKNNETASILGDQSGSACDPSNFGSGHFSSLQILLVPFDSTPDTGLILQKNNSITGPCYALTSPTTSSLDAPDIDGYTAHINLPTGNNTPNSPFYTVIRGYFGSESCVDDSKGFIDLDYRFGLSTSKQEKISFSYDPGSNFWEEHYFISTNDSMVCNASKSSNSSTEFSSGGSANAFWNGICNVDQLQSIGGLNGANFLTNKDKNFVLLNSINFYSGWDGTPGTEPGDTAFNIIGDALPGVATNEYLGVFEGNDHSIIGLNIKTKDYNTDHTQNIGFMRLIGAVGSVQNLNFIFGNIRAESDVDKIHEGVGLVAGENRGLITNIKIVGSDVEGIRNIGSVAGINKGTIDSTHIEEGSIEGHYNLGGLVGESSNGTISSSSFEGDVDPTHRRGHCVGGSTPDHHDFSTCTGGGGTWTWNKNSGGLVGVSNGTSSISFSKSSGKIIALQQVGGLVGEVLSGSMSISNSYSEANIISSSAGIGVGEPGISYIGGIIGLITGAASIDKTFHTLGSIFKALSTTHNTPNQTGIYGGGTAPTGSAHYTTHNSSTNAGVTITYANLRSESFLTTNVFDFLNDWSIVDGKDHPRLIWEMPHLCENLYTNTPFAAGTGTATDPYLICNKNQLYNINTNNGVHYKLAKSIDLESTSLTSAFLAPSNGFSGVLNGDDHFISGLNISSASGDSAGLGLFEKISTSGKIHNLGLLVSSDIPMTKTTGNAIFGTIVGKNYGIIDSVTSLSSMNVYSSLWGAGSIAGENYGVISGVKAFGNISGRKYIGGIAGKNYGGIVYSESSSSIIPHGKVVSYLAGIAGKNYAGAASISFYDKITGVNLTYDAVIDQVSYRGTFQGATVNGASPAEYVIMRNSGAITGYNTGTLSNISTDGSKFFYGLNAFPPNLVYMGESASEPSASNNQIFKIIAALTSIMAIDYENDVYTNLATNFSIGDFYAFIGGTAYRIPATHLNLASTDIIGAAGKTIFPSSNFGFCVGSNQSFGTLNNINCNVNIRGQIGSNITNFSHSVGQLVGSNNAGAGNLFDNVTTGQFNLTGANNFAIDSANRNYFVQQSNTSTNEIIEIDSTVTSSVADFSTSVTASTIAAASESVYFGQSRKTVSATSAFTITCSENLELSRFGTSSLYGEQLFVFDDLYSDTYWSISEEGPEVWKHRAGESHLSLRNTREYDEVGEEVNWYQTIQGYDL